MAQLYTMRLTSSTSMIFLCSLACPGANLATQVALLVCAQNKWSGFGYTLQRPHKVMNFEHHFHDIGVSLLTLRGQTRDAHELNDVLCSNMGITG